MAAMDPHVDPEPLTVAERMRRNPPRVGLRLRHTGVFPTIFNVRDPISEAKRQHKSLRVDELGLDLDPDSVTVRR